MGTRFKKITVYLIKSSFHKGITMTLLKFQESSNHKPLSCLTFIRRSGYISMFDFTRNVLVEPRPKIRLKIKRIPIIFDTDRIMH